MYIYPDPDAGCTRLENKLLEYAERYSEKMNLPIWVDRRIVKEAFGAACNSVQFHQIEVETLSHYKELAHIGFWIAQLKAIVIQPPPSPEYLVAWVKILARDVVFGSGAAFAPEEPHLRAAEVLYKKFSEFAISEHIALQLIADTMEMEVLRKISLLSEEHAEIVMRRFRYFKKVLYGKLFPDVAKALRFHIFTPRSFATFVETTFAFEGLDDPKP